MKKSSGYKVTIINGEINYDFSGIMGPTSEQKSRVFSMDVTEH